MQSGTSRERLNVCAGIGAGWSIASRGIANHARTDVAVPAQRHSQPAARQHGAIGIVRGWIPAAFMGNLPLNMLDILPNELLLAIPFFTLMGTILEKCAMAEDLLESMGQLFGPRRGGLGYSVIIVGAITGTVAG